MCYFQRTKSISLSVDVMLGYKELLNKKTYKNK